MLAVTSALAAVLAVMLVALSITVSLKRMKVGTRIGTGDDEALLRCIRAQGNFIEYVPIGLILCALAELRGAAISWLLIIAGLLLLGRLTHAAAMLSGSTLLRPAGMIATYLAILVGAAAQFLA